MRLVFGKEYARFMRFKADALEMTPQDFARTYSEVGMAPLLARATDVNEPCLNRILKDISGFKRALDVGCGKGYLAGRMAEIVEDVTASDVYVDHSIRNKYPKVHFAQSAVEHLSFGDRAFDVVVSTHMLEHVKNFDTAVAELFRVARSLVIIVVPRERPYKYTLNLHLHFFPYLESFLLAVKPRSKDYECCELDGDIYYRERVA